MTTTSVGATSVADPFDAGPYARIESALGIRRGRPGAVRRALVMAALAWLPLVVLAAAQGLLLRPDPHESLLLDATAYARYLVALPLLVVAEASCLPRLAAIAHQFVEADLVAERDRPRFDALIDSARRSLDHRGAEVVLLVAAYVAAVFLTGTGVQRGSSTWAMPVVDGVAERSLAGWWRLLVSQPLFLLLVGAWFWRIFVWARFLWGASRLDLRLVASHPDLAGGLFFLAGSLPAFGPVAAAFSATFAGAVAEAVLVDGQSPTQFRYVLLGLAVLQLAIFAGPLLVFQGVLRHAKLRGVFSYGTLASALGHRFEDRWIVRGAAVDAEALEAPDFSATIDLYSVVANVRQMRVIPVSLQSLAVLVAAMVAPLVPVALAVLPAERLRQIAEWLLF